MNYKVQAQKNFLQLEYQKVESKLKTYKEAYKEVKNDNDDLKALMNDAAVPLDQSEARKTLLQATLEKKVRSQQEYIKALTDEYGRVEDECRRLRDNVRDLQLA